MKTLIKILSAVGCGIVIWFALWLFVLLFVLALQVSSL